MHENETHPTGLAPQQPTADLGRRLFLKGLSTLLLTRRFANEVIPSAVVTPLSQLQTERPDVKGTLSKLTISSTLISEDTSPKIEREEYVYPSFYLKMLDIVNAQPVANGSVLWVTAEERIFQKDQIPPEFQSNPRGRINGTDNYLVMINGIKWVKGQSPELVKNAIKAKANAERNNCPATWLTFRNELGIDENGDLVLTDDPTKDTFISQADCCPSTYTFRKQPFKIVTPPTVEAPPALPPTVEQPRQPALPTPAPVPAPPQMPPPQVPGWAQ